MPRTLLTDRRRQFAPTLGIHATRPRQVDADARRSISALAAGRSGVDSDLVVNKKWQSLSPRVRRLLIAGATVEGLVKVAALIDLARRPSREVRGSKLRWAVAITLVNSVGAVPIAYFLRGRKR
jgi:hypothetical protein